MWRLLQVVRAHCHCFHLLGRLGQVWLRLGMGELWQWTIRFCLFCNWIVVIDGFKAFCGWIAIDKAIWVLFIKSWSFFVMLIKILRRFKAFCISDCGLIDRGLDIIFLDKVSCWVQNRRSSSSIDLTLVSAILSGLLDVYLVVLRFSICLLYNTRDWEHLWLFGVCWCCFWRKRTRWWKHRWHLRIQGILLSFHALKRDDFADFCLCIDHHDSLALSVDLCKGLASCGLLNVLPMEHVMACSRWVAAMSRV